MEKRETEIEALAGICKESKEKGKVTEENLSRLKALFGSRFLNAWNLLQDNRVKKYVFKPSGKVVWIVVGRERDYLIMPAADFCPCDDFYFNIADKKPHLCYHLIAQKLAESLGLYEKIEEYDDWYDILMREWRKATP
jgi:predicted nucleic acid-binding Zn finger protein